MTTALITGITGQDGHHLTKFLLEKGYKITKIYSALSYTKIPGLMKEYVGNFLKKENRQLRAKIGW